MPHASDEELRGGPTSRLMERFLFLFYAAVIVGTPVLFISYWVKYGA